MTPASGPNVSVALTEVTAVCDWMHASKKTGGLGYSEAQVKSTHAYKALVALAGKWPSSSTRSGPLPLLLNRS